MKKNIDSMSESKTAILLTFIAFMAGIIAHFGYWGISLILVLVYLGALGEYLITYFYMKPKFKEE